MILIKNIGVKMKRVFRSEIKFQKDFLIIAIIVLTISNGLFPLSALSQQESRQKLQEGITLFWNANFDDAIKVLQKVIAQNNPSKDEIFSANLYIGFSLLRKESHQELVEHHLQQAVRANPQFKLDSLKIPPDLLGSFDKVRRGMIGSIYITSNPPGAEVKGFCTKEKVEFQEFTPHLFKDLLAGTYQILIFKNDYRKEIFTFDLSPSVIDTLVIHLRLKKKPLYKNWWTWTAGGGVVLASLVAILSTKETADPPPESPDLPMPPERP